jgi:hypothetical protein
MNEFDYYKLIRELEKQLDSVNSLIAVVEQEPLDDWEKKMLDKAYQLRQKLLVELKRLGDLEYEQAKRKRREWKDPLLPI